MLRRRAQHLLALEDDPALVDREDAAAEVDQRRLASTILADERVNLAALD
jgi:hypothetical protein